MSKRPVLPKLEPGRMGTSTWYRVLARDQYGDWAELVPFQSMSKQQVDLWKDVCKSTLEVLDAVVVTERVAFYKKLLRGAGYGDYI